MLKILYLGRLKLTFLIQNNRMSYLVGNYTPDPLFSICKCLYKLAKSI
jgi:hypothetical protein